VIPDEDRLAVVLLLEVAGAETDKDAADDVIEDVVNSWDVLNADTVVELDALDKGPESVNDEESVEVDAPRPLLMVLATVLAGLLDDKVDADVDWVDMITFGI